MFAVFHPNLLDAVGGRWLATEEATPSIPRSRTAPWHSAELWKCWGRCLAQPDHIKLWRRDV